MIFVFSLTFDVRSMTQKFKFFLSKYFWRLTIYELNGFMIFDIIWKKECQSGCLYFQALRPAPDPGSQLFTGFGPQLEFAGPGSQFVFTYPGAKSVFTGPCPNLHLPTLAPNVCLLTLTKKNSFTGPGRKLYLPTMAPALTPDLYLLYLLLSQLLVLLLSLPLPRLLLLLLLLLIIILITRDAFAAAKSALNAP